jgi:hypothetical protein
MILVCEFMADARDIDQLDWCVSGNDGVCWLVDEFGVRARPV